MTSGGYKKFEKTNPQKIISLTNIQEIKLIEERDEGVFIGSGVTYTELVAGFKSFKGPRYQALEVLSTAVENIATVQLRNVASLVGGILWGHPASDVLPILTVAKAVLQVKSLGGSSTTINVDER